MTKLSTIPDHTLSITRGLCKHHSMLEVASLCLLLEATRQPTRYVREPDVITAELKATTRIRSSGGVTQMWRLMVLGLGQLKRRLNRFVLAGLKT